MTTLTPTQQTILEAAATRPDGAIHPLPKGLQGGAVNKVIKALEAKGLIDFAWVGPKHLLPDPMWRISEAGYRAIGLEPPEREETPQAEPAATGSQPPLSEAKPRRSRENTKQALVLGLLKRPEGATTAQIMAATEWQPHTVRGFLSLAKKRLGVEITTERLRVVGPGRQGSPGSTTIYRIPTEEIA